jgi:WD40 repeat protein
MFNHRPALETVIALGGVGLLILSGNLSLAGPPAFDPDKLPPGALARLGSLRLRHPDRISAIAFTPDGREIVSGAALVYLNSVPQFAKTTIRVWDASTGKPLRAFGRGEGLVWSLRVSPDGKHLLVSSDAVEEDLWDLRSGKHLKSAPLMAWFPRGGRVTAFSEDGIQLLDPATGREVRTLAKDASPGVVVAFTPDGKTYAFRDTKKGVLCVRTVAEDKPLWSVPSPELELCIFSPDGKRLAVADEQGKARVYATATGKLLAKWKAWKPNPPEELPAFPPAFQFLSPDGEHLAVVEEDGTACVYVAATGKPRVKWKVWDPKNPGPSEDPPVAVSPDGRTLATGGRRVVRLWDPLRGKLKRSIPLEKDSMDCLAFSPDGKTLAGGGEHHLIHLWDVATGKDRLPVVGHETEVFVAAFSSDGRLLASGDADGDILLWDPVAGKLVRRLKGHTRDVMGLAFFPDGRRLASAGWDGRVCIWDTATGRTERVLKMGEHIAALGLWDEGRVLGAFGYYKRPARVWDAATGKLLRQSPTGPPDRERNNLTFAPSAPLVATVDIDGKWINFRDVLRNKDAGKIPLTSGGVGALAFSPDGTEVAFVVPSRDIHVRGYPDGKERLVLTGHEGYYVDLAYSPDGRYLVSGDYSVTKLWERATGKEVFSWEGQPEGVRCPAFSPDLRRVVTGSDDSTLLVWDATGLLAPRAGTRPALRPPARCWEDLASADAPRGHRALWELALQPERSVPFLAKRLAPVPAVPAERVRGWVADLDADTFAAREQASRRLRESGAQVVPALEGALAKGPSPEMRRRLRALLKYLRPPRPRPDQLREIRAVAVLEYIGTPPARRVLKSLVEGDPRASLTRQAKSALKRLGR